MPRLNNEQLKYAVGMVASHVEKGLQNAIRQNVGRICVQFNNMSDRPKPGENARFVLQVDIPAKLLYEVERRLLNHG